jgi:hypothetical protein
LEEQRIMARGRDGEIDRIAREVSVQRLAEARAVVLIEGQAGDLVGACPLCGADEGLAVSPSSNVWACAGCGEDGGPVEWLMGCEGVSKAHAVELLREGLPATSMSTGRRPPKVNSRALLPAPFEPGTSDADLLEQVVGFYHRTLRESPQPAAYLERRKLGDAEMVEVFRLGFANRTLGYRLPAGNRAAGKVLRGQLQELGVWSAKGHEAYDGSLVVPILDPGGRIVQLYGRKIRRDLRKGTRLHTWLATAERPLFNPAALDAGDEVILAGSVIDALTLWCAGFRHVVGVDGVEGVDATHLAQLTGAGVRSVRIAFRRDDVGEAAAGRTATQLMAAGVECLRAEWPWGLDVNDYACISADVTGALGKVLRAASWMGKGTQPKPTRRSRRPPSTAKPATGASPQPDTTTEPPAPIEPDPDIELPDVELADVDESEVASAVAVEPDAVLDGDGMRVSYGDRRWRVRGLERNTSFDVLKVQVMVSVPAVERGSGFHIDSFDLYSARARASFVRDAADEVGVEDKVLKRDLGRVLMAAEALVEEAIRRAQEPADTAVVLDADERAAALELLCDPKLVDRITDDFARVGMVGEATNCLVGYLATISRKLDRPLAVIVQSTSAAGKSALQDAVMDFVPAEELVRYSAMTGQSLYYLGERDLAHKVLAIAEEEGAERASYALKLLQSEGELSIASTGKDNASGRLVTHPYRVQGPTAIFLTTTATEIDEELLNRCVVLSVNEDREQTRAIHDRQRRSQTLDGILAGADRAPILKVHRDAQRLLETIEVVNPHAHQLTFADGSTRTRRDHVKYLTLIRAIALLHQHQRPKKSAATRDGRTVTYIEATTDDIALANRLAHEVLGRSLDELSPQPRRLLIALDVMVDEIAAEREIDRDRVRFTRRQVRERLGGGDTQLKKHLARLVDLELVHAHRAEQTGGFIYELAWHSGHDGTRFLPGLVDLDDATGEPVTPSDSASTTGDRSAPKPPRSAPGRPPVAGQSPPGRRGVSGSNAQANGHKPGSGVSESPERASGDAKKRRGRNGNGDTVGEGANGEGGR